MHTPEANILLLLLDTARADHFEPYGAPAGATPVINDVARRGQAATAYAPANWTVPSHAALFTGRLPRSMDLLFIDKGGPATVANRLGPHREEILAAVLQRAGVATGAISANLWISPRSGFDIGFDRFESVLVPRQPRASQSLRDRLGWYIDAALARVDDGARAAEEILDRWIREKRSAPFFWFINLCECHSPYLPPRPYNDLSLRRRVLAGVEARRHLNFAAIMLTSLGEQQVPEAALERMRHLYARSITLMDNWLGRILQRLDDASLLDDTQVIVTSDHGENLGEQGRLGHAVYLDERLIKVPFVTAGPLDLDLDGAVGLVDIPAALGDALGLADHPWIRRSEDGVVVAQLDRWGTPGDPRLEEAAKTHNLSRRSVEQLAKDLTVATDARWKLVVSDDAESYYDLVADPLEAAPVDPEQVPHDRRTALRASAASARQRPAPSGEAHDAGPTTDDAGGLPSQDVTELEERMKLLGYL